MTNLVYLVDDDEAVRNALSLLLETVGLTVRSYASPETFLHQAGTLLPGCLILDIRMPAISGLKLHEKLAEQSISWPTVIISGHGDIDLIHPGIHKAAALASLGNWLHVDLEEMAAFGDGGNDIEMLKAVCLGVAMQNATSAVKAIANDETDVDNENQGVLNYLAQLLH